MATKVCTKCGIEKEATTEFFSFKKMCKLGLNSRCRECEKQYYRDYMKVYNNSEKHRSYMSEYMREYSKTQKYKVRRKSWDKEYGTYKIKVLLNSYVKGLLVENGFPKEFLTQEIIQVKSAQILLIRELKNNKNQIS